MSDHIEVLQNFEAIRKRPGMWLTIESRQPPDPEVNPATLLAQQLCVHALYLAHQGKQIELNLQVAPNHVQVSYNAPLALSDIIQGDLLTPTSWCTWDGCEQALHPLLGGLTIPIALTAHFCIQVQHNGSCEALTFRKGRLIQRDVSSSTTSTTHTCLECWFDEELLGKARPDLNAVRGFLRQHDVLPNLQTTFLTSRVAHLPPNQ